MGTNLVLLASLSDSAIRLGRRTALLGAMFLVLLVILATIITNHHKTRFVKLPLFTAICFCVLLTTSVLTSTNLYVRFKSDSTGEVVWRSGIEFWACGAELEIVDPSALSNKVGSALLHERDNKQIELTGMVTDKAEDASLTSFMQKIGGSINSTSLNLPVANRIFEDDSDGDKPSQDGKKMADAFVSSNANGQKTASFVSGQKCGSETAVLQTFVYKFVSGDKSYAQIKLSDPSSYLMGEKESVPPGDCVIVEFAPSKEKTDKLCREYGERDSVRCTEFGVIDFNKRSCDISEVADK